MPSNIYVPLHVHTPHSLLEGACRPEELARRAADFGLPAVAMTDTNTLAGIAGFTKAMLKAGIQPLTGIQIDVREDGLDGHLVLLAANESGWNNLVALINKRSIEQNGQVGVDSILAGAEGLICLSGSGRGLLASADLERTKDILARLKAGFGDRLYIQIERAHGDAGEAAREERLMTVAAELDLPIVAANETFFIEADMAEAHDALLCIGESSHVAVDDRRKTVPGAYLRAPEDIAALFSDIPAALENSLEIARRCSTIFAGDKPMLPAFQTSGDRSEEEELVIRARKGLEDRLSHEKLFAKREDYEARLDYEMGVITRMGFPGYFLIVSDFIGWAKDRGIAVGPGRGSGAGSLVAWSLAITDLDPIRYGLLFERFLNPDRVSMPDFDIDFEQARRGEVIAYVQSRYGADKAVQIGTYGKLNARGVIRDTGRVLQIPYPVVDRYTRMIPNNPTAPVTLAEAMDMEPLKGEIEKADGSVRKLFDIALKLEGLYRHASTHAAGVVIADRPVGELVPLMRDPHGAIVTQYDMKTVEEAGLVKFDFLGLKTLDIIEDTHRLIEASGETLQAGENDVEDAETYAMLARGDSFGVFQLESAGMRQAMRQIEPETIDDIVALVSLYRPGPMENIPAYAETKKGERRPAYLHPAMEEVLKDTNGIIIYQEQVMELARRLAGYTLGQADLLRRAMGKKIKAEMDAQRAIFTHGAGERGIGPAIAERIFEQIARFADYGFNKSHAAAYSIITFRTAFLKRHHPAAFMAATMNLELADVERLAIIVNEVRQSGIPLLAPCVNRSAVKFSLEREKGRLSIRYALAGLRNIGEEQMQILVSERLSGGPFLGLDDLARRTQLNRRGLEILVKAGACDSFGHSRASMLDAIPSLVDRRKQEMKKDVKQSSFFDDMIVNADDDIIRKIPEAGRLQILEQEFEALGVYFSGHPMELANSRIRRASTYPLKRVNDPLVPIKGEIRVGAMLSKLTVKTDRANKPMAILSLSDCSGLGEAMAFDEDYDRVSGILEENHAYIFTMGVSTRDGQRRLYVRAAEAVAL